MYLTMDTNQMLVLSKRRSMSPRSRSMNYLPGLACLPFHIISQAENSSNRNSYALCAEKPQFIRGKTHYSTSVNPLTTQRTTQIGKPPTLWLTLGYRSLTGR